MNDNSVGTPNPLNPAPAEPAAPATPAEPVAAAPKKKKTGLIVSLIISLIVLIGGAVAAVLILFVFNKPTDAVQAAISKVFSGEVQDYAITGTITASGDGSGVFSGLDATLDAKVNTKEMTNSITAGVSTNIGGMDLDFTFDERKVADGNMFVKINGVTESITGMITSMLEQSGIDCDEVDCDALIDQMMEGENNQFAVIAGIEDKWLHVDSDDISGMGNTSSASSQCLVDALSGSSKYGDDIAKLYNDNQFITYSTDDIKIEKKKDTIYKFGLDYDKMAGFINAMKSSELVNSLKACSSEVTTDKDVTAAELKESFANFPEVYVEIDGKNNFTRVYFTVDAINLVADLSIAYPNTITVETPDSYLEASDYLSDIFETFGGFSSTSL